MPRRAARPTPLPRGVAPPRCGAGHATSDLRIRDRVRPAPARGQRWACTKRSRESREPAASEPASRVSPLPPQRPRQRHSCARTGLCVGASLRVRTSDAAAPVSASAPAPALRPRQSPRPRQRCGRASRHVRARASLHVRASAESGASLRVRASAASAPALRPRQSPRPRQRCARASAAPAPALRSRPRQTRGPRGVRVRRKGEARVDYSTRASEMTPGDGLLSHTFCE